MWILERYETTCIDDNDDEDRNEDEGHIITYVTARHSWKFNIIHRVQCWIYYLRCNEYVHYVF